MEVRNSRTPLKIAGAAKSRTFRTGNPDPSVLSSLESAPEKVCSQNASIGTLTSGRRKEKRSLRVVSFCGGARGSAERAANTQTVRSVIAITKRGGFKQGNLMAAIAQRKDVGSRWNGGEKPVAEINRLTHFKATSNWKQERWLSGLRRTPGKRDY